MTPIPEMDRPRSLSFDEETNSSLTVNRRKEMLTAVDSEDPNDPSDNNLNSSMRRKRSKTFGDDAEADGNQRTPNPLNDLSTKSLPAPSGTYYERSIFTWMNEHLERNSAAKKVNKIKEISDEKGGISNPAFSPYE